MSLHEYHIDGIVIITGNYDDIRIAGFSDAQNTDVEQCRNEKQRRERALIYTLLNHAGRNHKSFSHITGASLGHHDSGAPFLKGSRHRYIPVALPQRGMHSIRSHHAAIRHRHRGRFRQTRTRRTEIHQRTRGNIYRA